ncbi:hypothetical protein K505DRAFT_363871 [Melanomma pulvis-pyrius CBS 109.77]|uniref:Uncharacterized protein n=1 Tax=Melanomma pulvis-pyrius CBS 109.77 TaxID=1314802 RepID=A0A6A6X4T5_9PLEO|nr:hypothetical protein K505DRAFT_363871 [Melanomma pulvis-pyrius CBS 109.77]
MAWLESSMPLSARAKALAQHFLNNQTEKLPAFLQPYAPLIQKLLLGVAAGGAIYNFYRYRNRAKLQLAIFHVLRIVEQNPQLTAILQDPDRLILEMTAEVLEMVPQQLTYEEGEKVIKELKRKVRNDGGWPLRKVRRVGEGPELRQIDETYHDEYVNVSPPPSIPRTPQPLRSANTNQASAVHASAGAAQSSTYPEPTKEDEDSGYSDVEEGTPIIPYSAPVWQKKSSQDHPRSPATTGSGYGFSYDDWSSSSEDSPPTSTNPPATKNISPADKPLPPQTKSMIDCAIESAFDPDSPTNRHLPPSAFKMAKPCDVRPKKAIRPKISLSRTPPTQAWIHTQNRNGILTGTDLSPIGEGDSFADSDTGGKTPYRVAETRNFYREVEAQRTARKKKKLVETVDTSPATKVLNQQIDALEQEIRGMEQEIGPSEQAMLNDIVARQAQDLTRDELQSAVGATFTTSWGEGIAGLIIEAAHTGTPQTSPSPWPVGARRDIGESFAYRVSSSSSPPASAPASTKNFEPMERVRAASPSPSPAKTPSSPAMSQTPAATSPPASYHRSPVPSYTTSAHSPVASPTPIPLSRTRGRAPKTPKLAKTAGVGKRAPKTPRNKKDASVESAESAGDVWRRSARKTKYVGRFGR